MPLCSGMLATFGGDAHERANEGTAENYIVPLLMTTFPNGSRLEFPGTTGVLPQANGKPFQVCSQQIQMSILLRNHNENGGHYQSMVLVYKENSSMLIN